MSDLRKYLLLTLVLVVVAFFKFNTFYTEYGRIRPVKQENAESSALYPYIAKSVNEKPITIAVDGETITGKDSDGLYMDGNLNLMIPVENLTDSLDCSAHIYDEELLRVRKREDCLELKLNNCIGTRNQEDYIVTSPLIRDDDEYYVSIQSVSEAIGYQYEWNAQENGAVLTDTQPNTSVVPSSFDLRAEERSSVIKNQGDYGTCWAQAALTALESSMTPEVYPEFSTDHMTIQSNFAIRQTDGGTFTMSMAYLTAWQGPVYEADDPYGDGMSTEGLSPVAHVQEAQLLPSKDYEAIKEAVMKYGGVETSIYNSLRNAESYSDYYNRDTYAYCYTGEAQPNHEVVIIGWDDSYPKENFKGDIEGDGAFICQNSWGTHFGEQGVFYVSYYDTNIGTTNVAYTRIDETDNYDSIYQSDLCGWVGQIGYGKDSIYGANVYTAESDEMLKAVGFYATGERASYEIYVVEEFTDTESLSGRRKVAEGTLEYSGYYTIDLPQPVSLKEGKKFAVVLRITVPNSKLPLAVEYYANSYTRSVDLSDGEGYISALGRKWDSAEETKGCNLCIKAYTENEK